MPRVMTAVEDLVARQASGVLEVSGNPAGAVYLDAGRIAFARASWVPGLAPRLSAACPELAARTAAPPSGGDADDAAVAAFAVQQGYLSPGALHELIGSIVVDAVLVLTVPLTLDSGASAIRFTSTRTYWTEMFPRFAFDQVRAEALRRAERMAEHGLSPATPVQLRDLRAPAAVLTREQWAVACQIGSPASALDVAARRGAALSDTLDCLGRMAQAGLCAPVRIPRREPPRRKSGWVVSAGRPGSGRPDQATVRPGQHPAAPARGAGPQRPAAEPALSLAPPLPAGPPLAEPPVPGPPQPPGTGPLPGRRATPSQLAGRAQPASAGQPPSVDVLRQVLSGLRKL